MKESQKFLFTFFIIVLIFVFTVPIAFSKQPENQKPELVISPAEAILTLPDGTATFTLTVENGDGVSEVKWRVTGSIGEITPIGPLTAKFTAGDKAARGAVIATAKVNGIQLTATALVKIAEGAAPQVTTKRIPVTVSPNPAPPLAPGDTQDFDVTPSGDSVQWRVIPGRIGTIDQTGLFTAIQPGKGLVVVTVKVGDSVGTGKASVVVSGDKTKPSPKLELSVKPEYARVDANGSTEFVADVKGVEKNTLSSVQWKVEPGNLGSIQPDTGDKVTFSAGTTLGKALITATLQVENEILTDWAVAEVVGDEKPNPAKFKVAISPESASLQVGDSPQFTASIVGSSVDLPVSWSWSVAPKKLGSVTPPNGDKTVSFTALEPGWGMLIVKADSNGRSMNVGQAKIFVSGKDGQNQKITIIPQSAEVNAGGSADFTVVDMNGNPLTGVSITWKAVPDKLGTISGTGSTITFKAGDQAGHVLIMAKVGDSRGLGNAQARLTIRNAYGKLKAIITELQPLRINEASNYVVSVTDSNGNKLDLTGANIEWRVVPNHLGAFDGTGESVFFTPTIAGRGVIMVEVNTSQGKITGRLSITVDKK